MASRPFVPPARGRRPAAGEKKRIPRAGPFGAARVEVRGVQAGAGIQRDLGYLCVRQREELTMNREQERLAAARAPQTPWKKWGPYLAERQWGTVREDYSDDGNAWGYFTHDQARSRSYRWGEDGLGGICDEKQRLCFALALWNGADPILKERLFGLSNAEGNHGEDVKEYYFYLDSTPTHSYMKFLYKYPQRAFPYDELVAVNASRSREEPEYELIDTGVFADDRYFDVFVEYAKAAPEDVLVNLTVCNRGDLAATLHLLPTLWFRDTWSWSGAGERPVLAAAAARPGARVVTAVHPELGERALWCGGEPALLFTENETNVARVSGGANPSPYVKDAFHRHLIAGESGAVNPAGRGTKAAAHWVLDVPARGEATVRLRLTDRTDGGAGADELLGAPFTEVLDARHREADEFYAALTPAGTGVDAANVMRQALAGMLWSKQYYFFDVSRWLDERKANPLRLHSRQDVRNRAWFHMYCDDIISMPDTWEYPWFAAWDLAFHTLPLSIVDADFASEQLALMLRSFYLHPDGQIPAYEWNFSAVNPPVHAWATLFTYTTEKQLFGKGDLRFLESAFQKLLINFTWWVNRKDPDGRNLFEGGFLGLDNIGVFDRSAPLPGGGCLEQADGTAWMAFYSQNMLEIAVELAAHDPAYQDIVLKFLEHFFLIAGAMDRVGENHDEMWDDEDGFFYDVLHLPDGSATRLRVRSMVGLLPLCAALVLEPEFLTACPQVSDRLAHFLARHPELISNIADPTRPGVNRRRLLSVLNEDKLRRVLARLLDEDRFWSPHGIRSLSRTHLARPYELDVGGEHHVVRYEPAESTSAMFGGNSNWRGPVWFPVNLLILRALLQHYLYWGDDFKVECPTRSGKMMTLFEVAQELTRRLIGIFLRGPDGRRPVYGATEKFQHDPLWRDLILFYEYFHGDNGAGIGASHQTGWTGTVARLIQLHGLLDPGAMLEGGAGELRASRRGR
jgi:hypothetical protein